jgi:predicted PurR-regulated permease PerM
MRIANPLRPTGRVPLAPTSIVTMAVAALGAVFLVVRLADVILLIFAAVLLAMLFLAIARPLQEKAHLPRAAALTAALLLLLAVAALLSWLFGAQTADQLSSLTVLLPRSWRALEGTLGETYVGRLVLDQIRSGKLPDNFLLTWATRFAGNVVTSIAAGVIVIAGAIYLAFHPETYAGGALKLVPRRHRARAAEVMEACRRALTQWMVGQAISMIFVACTAALGLWLAGVPSPFALGVLAGIGQIVPVVGPWAAAAPSLLVAAAQSPETFGLVLALYLIVTQVECNLLTPLVLRQMSEVPMAVTLFAVVAMGMLLGALGVLLATPLAVLAYVLVRTVYLEDVLGDRPDPDEAAEPPRSRTA